MTGSYAPALFLCLPNPSGKYCTMANAYAPEFGLDFFRATVSTEPAVPVAGQSMLLRMAIEWYDTGPGSWYALRWGQLMMHHSRLMHVQIVSDSLDVIWHLHPDTNGHVDNSSTTFNVTFTPPRAGAYRVLMTGMAVADPGLDMCVSEASYHAHRGPAGAAIGAIISETVRFNVTGSPSYYSAGPAWDVDPVRHGVVGITPGYLDSITTPYEQETSEPCSGSGSRLDLRLSVQYINQWTYLQTAVNMTFDEFAARDKILPLARRPPGSITITGMAGGEEPLRLPSGGGCVLFQIEAVTHGTADWNDTAIMEPYMGAEGHLFVAPLNPTLAMTHTHMVMTRKAPKWIACYHNEPPYLNATLNGTFIGSVSIKDNGVHRVAAWLKHNGKVYMGWWTILVGNCTGGYDRVSQRCSGTYTKDEFYVNHSGSDLEGCVVYGESRPTGNTTNTTGTVDPNAGSDRSSDDESTADTLLALMIIIIVGCVVVARFVVWRFRVHKGRHAAIVDVSEESRNWSENSGRQEGVPMKPIQRVNSRSQADDDDDDSLAHPNVVDV